VPLSLLGDPLALSPQRHPASPGAGAAGPLSVVLSVATGVPTVISQRCTCRVTRARVNIKDHKVRVAGQSGLPSPTAEEREQELIEESEGERASCLPAERAAVCSLGGGELLEETERAAA